ncbi:putative sucrose-phosphate synthase 1 [Camellia lanceoleosa]|uniref:Sucrose-phosphate synthase 1 n=1 Tax=Camellia lanceoleosa TaxID=1840588 RepID=A0ACC0F9J0_9ERIC|nr:putative sucrose-phosphate synthase 1 [Camellia lanceoleosa]
MDKSEPLQMSKQQEVGHDHCKCKAGIVAPRVVVESTVVPIDEHVSSPILVPKPNVVVESMVVPTVEHETNTLSPKPNIVVALENMEENRIPLTLSILKLDAHLHQQTKQVKNKMKVRLNNNQRKKIPKLQLIDESSSSTGPYGGPCTQHSDLVWTSDHLYDHSLSLNLLGKLLGLNFEASATAIESFTTQIVRPCPLSAEEEIVKAYCFDKDLESSEDIVVMELFYLGLNLPPIRFVLITTKNMDLWFHDSRILAKLLEEELCCLRMKHDEILQRINNMRLHGLIRGENMELGRDSDTGGQVKYVVELTRALGSMPGVYRVDLLTRQVSSPEVDWSYGEPTEKEAKLHTKGK